MIFFGFADSLWKKPTQTIGTARTIFYRNLFALLVVVPYFILSDKRTYISTDALWATLGISISAYCGLYFFGRAAKNGLTSVIVPITGANTLITMMLSIFTLEKKLNIYSTLGIFLTLVGFSMLKINLKNGRLQFVVFKDSGFRFALLAALFWGFSFAYSYYAVAFIGPALFTLVLECSILVFSIVHIIFKEGRLFATKTDLKDTWVLMALIGILGAIGSIFNTIALDRASINTVTSIVTLAPFISVIFGQAYYKERLTVQQKFAVVFIITGVFVISVYRYY